MSYLGHRRFTGIHLMGFLSKSHILLSSLCAPNGGYTSIMGFDLEKAVSAQSPDQIRLAFSFPLDSREQKLKTEKYEHYPVYRTDRRSERVEIVGVMRNKFPWRPLEKSKLGYKVYNFVTKASELNELNHLDIQ